MLLATTAERIDALARKPDGTLLISTFGNASVKNGTVTVSAVDEDLLAFQPTSLGSTTAGTWSLSNGFDGSLLTGMAAENVNGAWFDGATGDLYPVSYTHLDVYKRQRLVAVVWRLPSRLNTASPAATSSPTTMAKGWWPAAIHAT